VAVIGIVIILIVENFTYDSSANAATKGEVQMNVHQPGDPILSVLLGGKQDEAGRHRNRNGLEGVPVLKVDRNAVRVQFDA